MEFRLTESAVVFDVHPKVQAWFTTRLGGVSDAPFDTLNLSYGVGDRSEAVTENRRRAVRAFGRTLDEVVMPHQVHRNHIEWVSRQWRGRGSAGRDSIPATDGFLSDDSGVVLAMGFADCVPIYLTDFDARVVGLLHAGWRGTAAEIQGLAVNALNAQGIDPSRILAGIGPSIGPCCYEVDSPVYEAITRVAGSEPLTVKDGTHWWLDLKLANRILLERAGVLPDHIVEAPFCTGCRPDLFFSYRMQGRVSGRMGGYICLNAS